MKDLSVDSGMINLYEKVYRGKNRCTALDSKQKRIIYGSIHFPIEWQEVYKIDLPQVYHFKSEAFIAVYVDQEPS